MCLPLEAACYCSLCCRSVLFIVSSLQAAQINTEVELILPFDQIIEHQTFMFNSNLLSVALTGRLVKLLNVDFNRLGSQKLKDFSLQTQYLA